MSEGFEVEDLINVEHFVAHTGCRPLSAVLVVEAIDEDGDLALLHVGTQDLAQWKTTGMLRIALNDVEFPPDE